jgi:leucyl-tRNA synthetase
LTSKGRTKYKFSRQKPLDNFIVDFYCSELLLVVEIDGGVHLSFQIRDQERDEILREKYDILVIRYSNDEIINDVEKVLNDLITKIESRIFRSPPDKGD